MERSINRPTVYITRHYSPSEVYLTSDGSLAIDGGYPTESESSQESNPENPSGRPRSGRFRRNANGVTEYISDWQTPSSQPSLSQPGQGDEEEDQDNTTLGGGIGLDTSGERASPLGSLSNSVPPEHSHLDDHIGTSVSPLAPLNNIKAIRPFLNSGF